MDDDVDLSGQCRKRKWVCSDWNQESEKLVILGKMVNNDTLMISEVDAGPIRQK